MTRMPPSQRPKRPKPNRHGVRGDRLRDYGLRGRRPQRSMATRLCACEGRRNRRNPRVVLRYRHDSRFRTAHEPVGRLQPVSHRTPPRRPQHCLRTHYSHSHRAAYQMGPVDRYPQGRQGALPKAAELQAWRPLRNVRSCPADRWPHMA